MPWPFKSSKASEPPADGGALYERVRPGATLTWDEFEQECIDEAMEEVNRSNRRILEGLDGRAVAGFKKAFAGKEATYSATRDGLMRAAQRRYESEEFKAAANGAIKAIAVVSSSPGREKTGAFEGWLLLARIHASSGRFHTAAGMLKDARRAYATESRITAAHIPEGSLFDLRPKWEAALDSLDQDIQSERRPKPGPLLAETKMMGWYAPTE